MSIQLKLSNGGKRSFFVDIKKFPKKVKVPASKLDLFSHLFPGLFGTLFGYVLLRTNPNAGLLDYNVLIGLAIGLFSSFNLAKAIFGPKGSARLTFHETYVEARQDYWFTKKKWQTPYTEFKGVKARTGLKPKNEKLAPYQIIELIHQDTAKNLPLYAKRGNEKPTLLLNEYAKKFNLPIL